MADQEGVCETAAAIRVHFTDGWISTCASDGRKILELLQDFDFLRETLEIHLEEEGLMSFTPLLGAEVDPLKVDLKGVVECTAEGHVDGTVAEVIKKGYEIDLGTGMKIVRRAQVTVYKK
jgi:molecular chaperone GrpE (heat shock protein)